MRVERAISHTSLKYIGVDLAVAGVSGIAMGKLAIALAVAVFLYLGLSTYLPVSNATAVVIPWVSNWDISFVELGTLGVFATLMGR